MNNLAKTQQLVIDSREIAEMTGVNHWEILRKLEGSTDRKGYIEILNDNQMVVDEYFIRSEYEDEKGEKRPCYLFTKMGCEFIANKFNGGKGILFTAKYVKKFNEMEKQSPLIQQLSPQLQLLINMEMEQKRLRQQLNKVNCHALEAKAEVQAIKDIIVINPRAEWRKETNRVLTAIGYMTKQYQAPKNEVYKALEERAKCDLKRRLDNLQGRALRQGMSNSQANDLNYLDVIENDTRLKEIYIAIVKEMAIKNGVKVKGCSEID